MITGKVELFTGSCNIVYYSLDYANPRMVGIWHRVCYHLVLRMATVNCEVRSKVLLLYYLKVTNRIHTAVYSVLVYYGSTDKGRKKGA